MCIIEDSSDSRFRNEIMRITRTDDSEDLDVAAVRQKPVQLDAIAYRSKVRGDTDR